VHASNETQSLKDACFTKRSPLKINKPDEANLPLNHALDCPNCSDDGQYLRVRGTVPPHAGHPSCARGEPKPAATHYHDYSCRHLDAASACSSDRARFWHPTAVGNCDHCRTIAAIPPGVGGDAVAATPDIAERNVNRVNQLDRCPSPIIEASIITASGSVWLDSAMHCGIGLCCRGPFREGSSPAERPDPHMAWSRAIAIAASGSRGRPPVKGYSTCRIGHLAISQRRRAGGTGANVACRLHGPLGQQKAQA
jgi:hypothetical protein